MLKLRFSLLFVAIAHFTMLSGCGGGADDTSKPLRDPNLSKNAAASAPVQEATPVPLDGPAAPNAVDAATSPPAAATATDATSKKPAGGGLLGKFGSKSPNVAPQVTNENAEGADLDVAKVNAISADLSPSGDLLAAERAGGRIGLFDVNRRTALTALQASEDDLVSVRFDEARSVVAGLLPSGRIQLWQYQAATGLDKYAQESIAEDSYLKTLDGHTGGTTDLAFSPTREEAATVGADGTLRLWRLGHSDDAKSYERTGAEFRFAQTTPIGSHVAALTSLDAVTVWDVVTNTATRIDVGEKDFTCLAIDSAGKNVALGDGSGTVTIVDVVERRVESLVAHNQPIADLRFDQSAPRLFSITTDGEMRIWDLPIQPSESLEKQPNSNGLFAISPKARQIAFPAAAGRVALRMIRGNDKPAELLTALEHPSAITFGGDSSVALGAQNGQIEFLRPDGIAHVVFQGSAEISRLSSSGVGLLSAADTQGKATFWQIPSMQVDSPGGKLDAAVAGYDDRSSTLAWASSSGKVFIYDLARGELVASWETGGKTVKCLDVDARKNIVVTGDDTGLVQVWQVNNPDKPLAAGKLSSSVSVICLDESASVIYAGGASGDVRSFASNASAAASEAVSLPVGFQSADFSSETGVGVAMTSTAVYSVDLSSGKQAELSGVPTPVASAVSANGKLACFVDGQGSIIVVDLASGQTLATQENTENKAVDIAFASANELVSLHASGQIGTWSLPASGKTDFGQLLSGLSALDVNDERTLLAVGTEKGLVRFLTFQNSQESGKAVQCDGAITHLSWLSNNLVVVATSGSQQLTLIDVAARSARKSTGKVPAVVESMCRRRGNDEVYAVAGTKLVKISESTADLSITELSFKGSPADRLTSCGDLVLLASGGRLFQVDSEGSVTPDQSFTDVAVVGGSTTGRTAAILTESGTLMSYNGKQTETIGPHTKNQNRNAAAVSVSNDGRQFIVWSSDGAGTVWSAVDKKIVQSISTAKSCQFLLGGWFGSGSVFAATDAGDVHFHSFVKASDQESGLSQPKSLSISKDGRQILVQGQGRAVVVDRTKGAGTPFSVANVEYSEFVDDTDTVVLVSKDGTVTKRKGSVENSIQVPGPVVGISLGQPAGTMLVGSSGDAGVSVVDLNSMKSLEKITASKTVSGLFHSGLGTVVSDADGKFTIAGKQTKVSDGIVNGHRGLCTGLVTLNGTLWSAGKDGRIRLWTSSLTEIGEGFKHDMPIGSLRISSDRQRIVATDSSGRMMTFPIGEDALAGAPQNGPAFGEATKGVDVTPDGRFIVQTEMRLSKFSGSGEQSEGIRMKGQIIDAAPFGQDGMWYAIDDSGAVVRFGFASGKVLVKGSDTIAGIHWLSADNCIVVHGTTIDTFDATGAKIRTTSLGTSPAISTSVSQSGKLVAISLSSGEVTILDSTTLNRTFSFQADSPASLVQIDDAGEVVLLGGGRNFVEEWDVRKGVRLRRLSGHSAVVRSATYVQDKSIILTGAVDGEIRQWVEPQIHSNRFAAAGAKDFRLMPDGKGAISIDTGGIATLWNDAGKVAWKSKQPVADLRHVAIDRFGNKIALLHQVGTAPSVTLHERQSDKSDTLPVPPTTTGILFTADALSLVATTESSVEFFELSSKKRGQSLSLRASECLLASADLVLFEGTDGLLHRAGSSLVANVKVATGAINSVAYNDDGDRIATGTADGVVTVWQRSESEIKSLAEFRTNSAIRQLIFSGKLVVARNDSLSIRIWLIADEKKPEEVGEFELTHAVPVTLMRLDARQEFLLTAGPRNEVFLWYLNFVPGPPKKVLSLEGHEKPVVAFAFADRTRSIVTVDSGAMIAINPMPDAAELRERFEATSITSEATGILDELPKTGLARKRSGNDLLTQQLLAQEKFRRERLEQQKRQAQGKPAPARTEEEATKTVENMGQARSAQIVMSASRDEGTGGGTGSGGGSLYMGMLSKLASQGSGSEQLPDLLGENSDAGKQMAADYRRIDDGPAEIEKAAASGETASTTSSTESLARRLQKKMVEEQKSFTRRLNRGAVDSLLARIFGSSDKSKDKESLRLSIEQSMDSRSVQTLYTDFEFPNDEQQKVTVGLSISRDGRTLVSSFPLFDTKRDETSEGSRLDVWDMLSGVPLKRFDASTPVRQLVLSPSEEFALTLPTVVAYSLFENRSSNPLTTATFVAFRNNGDGPPTAALGKRTGENTLGPLMQLYDAGSMESISERMPEGFNASARAIAFANSEDLIALSVSQQSSGERLEGLDHRLYFCRQNELSSFEVLKPIDRIDARTIEDDGGGAGFAALAFSPDDQRLAAVAQHSEGADGFSLYFYSRQRGQWTRSGNILLDPAAGAEGGGIKLDFVGDLDRIVVRTQRGLYIGDQSADKRKRKEQTTWNIPFPADVTSVAMSDDSRRAAIGTTTGAIYLFDLASKTPDSAVRYPVEGDSAHAGSILSMAFSRPLRGMADPTYLVSFGRENRIKVWSLVDVASDIEPKSQEELRKRRTK